jgi:DNA-binding IscR family transcriptional regulator
MALIGKGTEYALHCLLFLIDLPDGASLTVSDMAEFQGVSQLTWRKYSPSLRKLDWSGLQSDPRGASK